MSHADSDKPLLDCRILVVEDDFLIAEVIADAIRDAGADVVGPFASMVDALEHLTDIESIHGAVLDVGLNEEESYPLADALQITRIPFMFLTGVLKDRMPARFAHVAHMLKPCAADRLVQMLQDIGVRRNRAEPPRSEAGVAVLR